MSVDISNLLLRVKSIVLGPFASGNESYEWFGIRNIKWTDVSPWVHIDIPAGPMLHQHLRSPHITGEIIAVDLDAIHTALFVTAVNTTQYGYHPLIDINNNNRKYPATYCRFKFINHKNEIVEYSVSKFRIETIGPDLIELGHETRWNIRFSADLIKKET